MKLWPFRPDRRDARILRLQAALMDAEHENGEKDRRIRELTARLAGLEFPTAIPAVSRADH